MLKNRLRESIHIGLEVEIRFGDTAGVRLALQGGGYIPCVVNGW